MANATTGMTISICGKLPFHMDVKPEFSTHEDNDAMIDDGNKLYEKALVMLPCLLIVGKDGKKKFDVILTKPDGKGGYTEEMKANVVFVCKNTIHYMRKSYKIALRQASIKQ